MEMAMLGRKYSRPTASMRRMRSQCARGSGPGVGSAASRPTPSR